MAGKNLKIILTTLTGVGVLVCILVWIILSGYIKMLPPGKPWLIVTDDLGRKVTIYRKPERIISLSPSNTEILFALGLDKEIVGVTEFCNYPSEAQTKEKIGGYSNPNLEKIASLRPDLILVIYGTPMKVINQIEELDYTLIELNPKTMEDVFCNINLAGKITDKDKEASKLIANMRRRLNSIAEKVNGLTGNDRSKVFYVVWYPPLWTAGSETFIDELIKKAGGVNIAKDLSGYKQINLETVIQRNPQVMVVGESKDQPGLTKVVRNESILSETDAFRDNQIYTVDTDIVSRPGPRIVDALEELSRLIHPELFNVKGER